MRVTHSKQALEIVLRVWLPLTVAFIHVCLLCTWQSQLVLCVCVRHCVCLLYNVTCLCGIGGPLSVYSKSTANVYYINSSRIGSQVSWQSVIRLHSFIQAVETNAHTYLIQFGVSLCCLQFFFFSNFFFCCQLIILINLFNIIYVGWFWCIKKFGKTEVNINKSSQRAERREFRFLSKTRDSTDQQASYTHISARFCVCFCIFVCFYYRYEGYIYIYVPFWFYCKCNCSRFLLFNQINFFLCSFFFCFVFLGTLPMNIRVQRCDVTWNNNNDIQQTSEQQTYNRKPILSWDIVFGICAGQRSSKQLYSHWVVDTLYGWVFTKFFTNTYNISYSKFHYIINVFNIIKHHTLRSTSMWVCACLVCWCWLVCNYMARCMLAEWPLECTVDNDRYSLLLCVIFLFCAFMLFDVRCRTNCRRSSVLYGSSIDFWFVLCEHIVVFGWGCGTRANAVI